MLSEYYLFTKALHIIAIISWMAGMLYLPRLFVYHAEQKPGSDTSEVLKIMEKKLLRLIITPAMIVAILLGILLGFQADSWSEGWLHAKLFLVFIMVGVHHMLARHVKAFAEDRNTRSHVYYRYLNEVPAVLMIFIVFLVVLKPF